MFDLLLYALIFAAGYAASVYTFPTFKVWVKGATAEAQALRAKAVALETKARGL